MPRNGQGVYSLPPVYNAVTGETIQAQQHNVPLEDLAKDANDPRPITTGGTGGGSAAQARAPENLDVYSRSEADAATGTVLKNAAAKAVPVDNDGVVITDSEDGGKIKRVLWSVVKAFIAGIYQPLLSKTTYVELNGDTTADKDVSIDYHATAGVDFNARLRRVGGTNGTFEIVQTGTGLIDIYGSGGVRIQGATSFTSDVTVAGSVNAVRTFNVKAAAAAESAHLYLLDETGAVRGIVYAANNKSVRIATNGGTQTFVFDVNGTLIVPGELSVGGSGAKMIADGNVMGTRWQTWGSIYAFNAIDARIEQRTQDLANTRVSDSRMAGEINLDMNVNGQPFGELHNSGYVLTRVLHNRDYGLLFGSRQPQLYIQNRGWFAAFPY